MTREIKFRARITLSHYAIDDGAHYEEDVFIYYTIGKEFTEDVFDLYKIDDFKECIDIQEYTGIMDTNKKEICEGDIVKCKYQSGRSLNEGYTPDIEKYIVEFERGRFSPMTWDHCCSEDTYYSEHYYDFEIIGNIYDNPELIE